MSTIGQMAPKPGVSRTYANGSDRDENISNSLLDDTQNDSSLTTSEAHETAAQHFSPDADAVTRSRWASRWQASLRVGGHFLQGLFGVAAFRAAYVRARGHDGQHRAGPTFVRYDAGRTPTEWNAGKRTQQQAKTASWSEFIGALPTIPLSVATAIVGGLCGLCARVQRQRRNNAQYRATRDRLVTQAIVRNLGNDPAKLDTESNALRLIYIEVAKRASDAWRASHRKDQTTPVAEESLTTEINCIVNAFGDLATMAERTQSDGTPGQFYSLAISWIQSIQEPERTDLVRRTARIVEDFAVRRYVMRINNDVCDAVNDEKSASVPKALKNQPLAMSHDDFNGAFSLLVDSVFREASETDNRNSCNRLRELVIQQWKSEPHSLYNIMTNIR